MQNKLREEEWKMLRGEKELKGISKQYSNDYIYIYI